MNPNEKLTEDQTIEILIKHLKNENWKIESYCLGQQKGIDIIAFKGERRLFVEVKGARASDKSPTKKNAYFNSSQIRTHFGVAMIKAIKTQNDFPNDLVAIAQPDDNNIREVLYKVIPALEKLDIIHYWVKSNGVVSESY